MNKTTFGIHFVLRMNKIINGIAPIYARITVDSKRCEVSVKSKIALENWNSGKGMAKSNLIENKQLNSYLEQIRTMMVQYYQELVLRKQVPTPEAIKNKFLGLEVSDMTLCKLIEYHNLNSKETLSWGTLKNYFTTQKYIEMFLKEKYRTSDIHLASLNYKFLAEFEYFLRQHSPVDHQRPMENNTVMKHIERLKKMIKMAIRYEWLEKDPFIAFPILPVALEIINKYKNDPRSIVKNSLFPNISNQKLNSYLKEIADICEISKNMTFHLARHTFATTVTLTNGVPIESVSKMLGLSKISTTQIYAKVIEKKVGEDMKKLKERLKQR